MANRTRTQLRTDSVTLFPDNNSQLISPQDLKDWITNGIDSFLTQKDSSAMQNVIYENKGNSIPSAATVDLSTATGNFLHITGTTNISSFGICQAGSRFVLVFDGVLTLTYNGTSLIIPGSANKTTASGDCCMIVSEGFGNWRIVGYFPISGSGGGGGGTVTSITASSPLTGGTITTSGSIGIANAAADGATKGAATFDSNDFNASSGLVSIDYANGQKANGSQDGFLSSGDWTTFNGKGSGTITALTGDVTASGTGSVAATIANGAVDIAMLSATGSPSATTFLRGDNVWATPAGASATGYYAMYQDLVTQTAAANNTGYPMKFRTMDLSNQVSVVSDTRITFTNAGIYNLQFSSQFQNADSQLHDVTIWLRLNGTNVSGSAGFVSIPNSHGGTYGHLITGWNYLLSVSAGDYYELVWSTDSATNVTMQYYAAGSPPPSTASTIFTVTQQAGIMAGTGITGMVGTTGSTQTGATQTFASSDMTITSASNTHTFAIPSAGIATNGFVDTSAQTFTGIKSFGNGTSAGEIRFLEGTGSGLNYVALKSNVTMSADYSLTLPSTAPTEGQVMVSNSSGGLSWSSTPGRYSQQYLRAYGATTTSLTEVKLQSILIPANTFTDMNGMQIMAMVRRTLTGSNTISIKLYINTTDAVGGFNVNTTAYSVAFNSATPTIQYVRTLFIQVATGASKNTITITQATPSGNNIGGTGEINSSAIDWAVDQYLVLATTQSNVSGSITCNALQILPS